MSLDQSDQSVYSHAFRSWEHLHKSLVTLIDDYHDACTSLRSICTQYPRFPHDRHAQREVMKRLDSELPSVLLCEQKLGNIRIILQGTRNTSRDLVLFNSFPPEILSRIFGFAVQFCASDELATGSCPSVVAGVCRHWRQVAMNTPSLWSHIDLEVGGLYDRGRHKRAKTWLERSRKTLLHIHIDELDAHNSDYQDLVQPEDLIDVLKPHADRFSSLDLNWSENDYQSTFFHALTKAWLETGIPGVLKSITLFTTGSKKAGIASIFNEMSESGHWSHKRPNPLLLAVSTISLHEAYFPFDSGAFHGLAELRLSGEVTGDDSPLLHQLLKVLGASPGLRTLVLSDLRLRAPAETHIVPVRLNQLEHLSLVDLDSDSSSILLTYLLPGSGPLDLSLDLSTSYASAEQLKLLLERSAIAKLYLKLPPLGTHDWVSSLSSPNVRLRRLALEGFESTIPTLSSLPSFFAIYEIFLLRARFDLDSLKRLAFASPVQKLHLWACSVGEHSYKGDRLEEFVSSARNADLDMARKLVLHSYDYYDNPIRHWTIHPER